MRTEKLYSYVGARITEIREEKNITKSELAKALDVSRDYINKLEGGRAKITIPVLLQICSFLDVDVNDLLGYPISEEVFPYAPAPASSASVAPLQSTTEQEEEQAGEDEQAEMPAVTNDMNLSQKSALLELLKKYQVALEEGGFTVGNIHDLGIMKVIKYLQRDIASDYERDGVDKAQIASLTSNYRQAGRKRKYTAETEEMICELSAEGKSLRDISKKTGVPETSVYNILRRRASQVS